MKNCVLLVLLITLGGWFSKCHAAGRVVCYFGSWSTYRTGNGKFDVENINPKLCTHLIYSFVGLNEDASIKVLDPYNDLTDNGGKGAMQRFVGLKSKNPKLKTMIAIGGASQSSKTFSNVVSSPQLRAALVKNALDFTIKHKFDGMDLDWEYPAKNGGQKTDIENFVKLVSEMKEQFGKHKLLLSAAVGATLSNIQESYDVPKLSKYLDFINVMTYDLHGPWDGVTGQNAPLYASSKDTSAFQKQLNVKACIDAWISKGAARSKLNLGMGAYGRSFTLDNPANHGLGAKASKAGDPGPYTKEAGMLGYNEIVEDLRNGWTRVWDDQQKVPYMYKGNQWVGYDDPQSIKAKMGFLKQMKLGGAMLWSIDTDDFRGVSGKKFPILTTITGSI